VSGSGVKKYVGDTAGNYGTIKIIKYWTRGTKEDVCAVIEDKVGKCMGSITKELKLEITDLCSKVMHWS
jgi:hypothetical protein